MRVLIINFLLLLILPGCFISKTVSTSNERELDADSNSSNVTQTQFWGNGQKQSVINFKNGELHGSYKSWHPNGKVRNEFKFINGKKEGKSVTFSSDGIKIFEEHYKEGNLQGESTEWSENGHLVKKVSYINGSEVDSLRN